MKYPARDYTIESKIFGNAGGTSAKKLWTDSRLLNGYVTHSSGEEVNVMCKCCTTYTEWKKKHQDASRVLQHIADIMPCLQVMHIHAIYLAPLGACKGVALKSGPYPYICDACEAWQKQSIAAQIWVCFKTETSTNNAEQGNTMWH